MISLQQVIRPIALTHGLNPDMIAAIALQESRGNRWAVRYEEAFYRKYLQGKSKQHLLGYVPNGNVCSLETELRMRATSFGLMQIMGETAREMGYGGDYISGLFIPEINIEYGCRYLKGCLEHTKDDVRKALLRYNGGSNKAYDDRVLSILETGEFTKVYNTPREELYERREICD